MIDGYNENNTFITIPRTMIAIIMLANKYVRVVNKYLIKILEYPG